MTTEVPQEHIFTMQYYPTDFFYSTNSNDIPDGFEGCTILKEETKDLVCSSMNENGAGKIYKCYQNQLCLNKSLVDKLYTIRNQHYASEQRYDNVNTKYHFEVVKTVNLLLGIVGTILFIRYNKGSS
jgi:hypothetical protein